MTYEEQRNALIPEAEKFADNKFGKSYKGTSDEERNLWRANWNLAFFSQMDKLYWSTCEKGGIQP